MLNKNDFHYILRRFVVFILISIAMFIIGIFKARAITLTTDATKYGVYNFSPSSKLLNINDSNNTTLNAAWSLNKDIVCDSNTCGIEFTYTSTCSVVNNSGNNISGDYQIIAVGSQIDGNGYPTGSVVNNTITFIVNNNYHINGLSLYFKGRNLGTGIFANCSVELLGSYTVYNIPDSITSAIQQNTQAVQETNNTIKDSNVDTDSASSSFSDLESQMASNGTISSLLTMPITLLQKLLSGLSGNCSAYPIEIFGYNMTFECIQPTQYIGSTLWNIIDVVLCWVYCL